MSRSTAAKDLGSYPGPVICIIFAGPTAYWTPENRDLPYGFATDIGLFE